MSRRATKWWRDYHAECFAWIAEQKPEHTVGLRGDDDGIVARARLWGPEDDETYSGWYGVFRDP